MIFCKQVLCLPYNCLNMSRHPNQENMRTTVVSQLSEKKLGYGPINRIYLSRFVQMAGNSDENMPNKYQKDGLNMIQWKLQKLFETVSRKEPQFSGKLIGVGSYFEGIQIAGEELDFVYELQDYNVGSNLDITLQQEQKLNTFNPREKSNAYPATYFRLKQDNKFINPRSLQEKFKETIAHYLVELFDTDQNLPIILCKGPAVTFFVENSIEKDGVKLKVCDIKIDITLSIAIKTGNKLLSDWFASYSPPIDVSLNKHYQDSIRSAHLVPSGDYWKLSLSVKECELVREAMLSRGQRICYTAIKVGFV